MVLAVVFTVSAVCNSVAGVMYLINPDLVGENFRWVAPWMIGGFFLWGQVAWIASVWEEAK